MWKVATEADYERSHRWYEKKRERELRAVLVNLQKVLLTLEAGAKPANIQGGFIHREPQGVIAISQQGGGKNLQETRLYLYVCEETETVHLIVIGDKREQSRDLKLCKKVVDRVRSELSTTTATAGLAVQIEQDETIEQPSVSDESEAVPEREPDDRGAVGEP